ncbi:MAG: insulinase family protein [Bacteroidales bacterium]|nr:insulinase family protein [Bacteroidales bacterium]
MKKFFTLAAAFLCTAAAFAQNPLPNDPAVKVGKLDNGMTYYIRHNDKPAQRCEFYLATNAGAINEGPGQDGLAHFLEHMCFNGLKNLPGKQMLNYLQSIGASFGGNINASTGVETTQYMLNNIPVVREGVIDTCLLVMHDYSHFVLNEAEEIDAERGVILEEKRTRNTAGWRMFEKSAPYLYGDTKYAVTNVIGSEENLKTFTRETLVDFYQTWYRPDKQALIVVGDIDVDQIESKIKTLFADIPAAENPKELEPIVIPDNAEPVVAVLTDDELSSNSITVMYRRPAVPEQYNNTDVVFVQNLVISLFSNVMSERFGDITAKPGAPFMAASLGSGNLCESCDAVFGEVSFKNGEDLKAFEAFMTEYERAKRYGVTDAELQRAKDNLLAHYEKAVQGADTRKNADFIRPIMNNFFDNTPYMEPQTRHDFAKMVCSQLNAAVVNQMMGQLLNDQNMVVLLEGSALVEHPSEAELLAVVNASRTVEVSEPVAEENNLVLMDASALKGSKVKKTKATVAGATEWTLKNGIRVVVLPTDYKKDEVRISLSMDGGECNMSDDELYSFENNIWSLYLSNTGLAGFSSTELSKVLSGKTVSCNPVIGNTTHGINANSTPKDLETAFQLLYLTFTQPRFDQDEYNVGIENLMAVLPNLKNDPMFALQTRIPSAIYESTPRRFAIDETVVEKANLQTLEKVYRRLFKTAKGAVVTIVGNVEMETLKPMVEKYIGSLPCKGKATKWVDDKVRYRAGETLDHFTTKMTTPKVSVLQVYHAPMANTVENKILLNAVTYIMNMVYTDTLREEEGGTYGASVSGNLITRPVSTALVQVFFDTNVDQAAALEALARKGMKELAENGPSDDYFNRTVEYFKNSLQQQRINNSYWAGVLDSYYTFGYDSNAEREAAINALTKEKIAAYMKAVLEAGNFIEMELGPQAE